MANLFHSKLYIEPGADVYVDFDATPSVSNLATGTVLLLGDSENGLDYSDKKIYSFTSLADARAIMKDGPALKIASCLFNPVNDGNGASTVLFVRTNKGKRAEFQFASGSQKKVMRYAVVTIASATPAGRVGFTIQVNGKYPVDIFEDITTTLSDALNALLADVNEILGVSAELSGTTIIVTAAGNGVDFAITNPLQPANTTVEVSTTTTYSPTFQQGVTVYTKDKGRNQNYSIKLSEGLLSVYDGDNLLEMASGVITAAQLVDAFKASTSLSKLFTVDATDESLVLATTVNIIPFKCYPNDPTTFIGFSEALELTSSRNKNFVVSTFEDEGYHQLLKNYTNSSEYDCMAFIGRGLGETPSTVRSKAATFNSENCVLAYPGVRLNLDGTTKLYSPVYFAAIAAGCAAGLEPQNPLTRKNVNVLGFEDIDYEGNSEQAVREDLINNGVLFGRYTEDLGYFINKGINTIQNQNNRSILETDNRSHEISIVRIKQQMKKEIKVSANRTFPGTNRLHPSITDVQDFIRKYLNSKVGTYLTGWDAKSLTVRLQQDAWYCSATAFVNAPVNQFFLDLSFALDDSISV